MSQFLNLALGVPFVLAAAGWPLGPLLFVLLALAAPFLADVPIVVAEPVLVVPIAPSLFPCLCWELDL